MIKKKVIWLDIGTHLAQEYRSLFGSASWFWWKMARRLVAGNLFLRGHPIRITHIPSIYRMRNEIKSAKDHLHFSFIEPNTHLVSKSGFFEDQELFCLALGLDKNNTFTIGELFHPPWDKLSQGSSIYFQGKGYKDLKSFVCCPVVDSKKFMVEYKAYLDRHFAEYAIILRLNCEGSEDDAIFACREVFGSSFGHIFGSLKDVKAIKGEEQNQKLQSFLKKNDLIFTEFTGDPTTWREAFSRIKSLLH